MRYACVVCLRKLSFLLVLAFGVGTIHGHSDPNARLKAMLKKAYPEAAHFLARTKSLTPVEIKRIEERLEASLPEKDRELRIYVALVKKAEKNAQPGGARQLSPIGTVLILDATGPKGTISLAVSYKATGAVHRVIVIENQDEQGVESVDFLRQFSGKGKRNLLQIGQDLQYPGDPQSGAAVANAVKRGFLLLEVAFT